MYKISIFNSILQSRATLQAVLGIREVAARMRECTHDDVIIEFHRKWKDHCMPVTVQYSLTKINGGDRSGMFLAVGYHVFLITVLLHNTV